MEIGSNGGPDVCGRNRRAGRKTRACTYSVPAPLTIGKGVLQNFATMDPPIVVPVGFYVIKHPKGNILFDTGNNDKLIEDIELVARRACKVSSRG